MNSLNELLGQKADNIFDEQTNTVENTQKTIKQVDEKIDLVELKATIYKMKDQLEGILRVLNQEAIKHNAIIEPDTNMLETGERIVEGVFDGEQMIGADGKEYAVPANYASKSKLIEGDMMKLTISNLGSFIYKQIGPIARKRITGELVADPDNGRFSVLADGKTYKVLTASVTFFKGKSGDEVVLLVPQDSESEWGALENIIIH